MTTLTFALSRAVGRILSPGDEIVVTRLDHDANIAPWVALEERGAVVRHVDFDPGDCTLNMAGLEAAINPRTKLVALGYASNAVGTINDIPALPRWPTPPGPGSTWMRSTMSLTGPSTFGHWTAISLSARSTSFLGVTWARSMGAMICSSRYPPTRRGQRESPRQV